MRSPCLPLQQRISLYHDVLRLRQQGLSYNKIVDRVQTTSGVRLNTGHASEWVRGTHTPLGNVNTFDAKPSPELAGVIGTMLSDGNRQLCNYRLSLRVVDRDFAERFGRDLAEVLGKKKPYKPRWSHNMQRWVVTGDSTLLYGFLDRPWRELTPSIEHCRRCVAAFLRAFFDGEGSIAGRALTVYNTNKQLLLYVQQLLQRYFGIQATGPHKGPKAGQRFRNPNNGKIYETKKTCYKLYIRVDSLPSFRKYIGFTVERKQQRLSEAIQK